MPQNSSALHLSVHTPHGQEMCNVSRFGIFQMKQIWAKSNYDYDFKRQAGRPQDSLSLQSALSAEIAFAGILHPEKQASF
jgi:hypothetical protein